MKNSGKNEKRRHQRYVLRNSTLATVSPADTIVPCQIIDISRQGLAFRYNVSGQLGDDLLEIDLVDAENMSLNRLPIRIVSDSPLDDSSPLLRRCGVQFGELTPNQQAQLEYFIQKNTVGVA